MESAKIVVPFSNPSSSTLGNRSSRGSAAAAALPPVEDGAAFNRSADVLVGTGAGVPSALSNSLEMVDRSWGLTSSSRSLMPVRQLVDQINGKMLVTGDAYLHRQIA